MAVAIPMFLAAMPAPSPSSISVRGDKPAILRSEAARRGDNVTINYSPNVTVHALGGDPSAIHRAVIEALKKESEHLYEMLNQLHQKRQRARFD